MNNIKELLSNFTKEDYEKYVNLHIHTTYSDGKCTPDKILQQVKEIGLKYFAITDHNTVEGLGEEILNSPLLIPAVEFDCWYLGCLIHILGYGIDVHNPKIKEICAKTKAETEMDTIRLFKARPPQKVIDAIHEAGGVAVLAHPACCWVINLEHFISKLVKLGLDGLEVYYPYRRHRGIIKFHLASNVEKTADKLNLLKTGGTDEHGSLIN